MKDQRQNSENIPPKKREKNNSPSSRKSKPNEREMKAKKTKKGESLTLEQVKEWLQKWTMTISICVVILGVFGMKAVEERYMEDSTMGISEVDEVQHFKALNLSYGATDNQIRSAYRKLSVKWHPDNNPNCVECVQKFNDAANAYNYFIKKKKARQSSAHKRKNNKNYEVYDHDPYRDLEISSKHVFDFDNPQNAAYGFYPNFDRNHVWCVLLYEEYDEFSKNVRDLFEETAQSMKGLIRFGMMGTRRSKQLLKELPVNVKIFPTLLIMGLDMHPELYALIARPSVSGIKQFIDSHTPHLVSPLTSLNDIKNYRDFETFMVPQLYRSSRNHRILIYPSSTSLSETIPMIVKSVSVEWAPLSSFGFIKRKDIPVSERYKIDDLKQVYSTIYNANQAILDQDDHFKIFSSQISNSAYIFLVENEKKRRQNNKNNIKFEAIQFRRGADNLTTLNNAIQNLLKTTAPQLYSENFNRLCRSNTENKMFCVLIMHKTFDDEKTNKDIENAVFGNMENDLIKVLGEAEREYLQNLPKEKSTSEITMKQKRKKKRDDDDDDDDNDDDDNDDEDAHNADEHSNGPKGDEPIHIQIVHFVAPSFSLFSNSYGTLFMNDYVEKETLAILIDMDNDYYYEIPMEKTNKSNIDKEKVKNIYRFLDDYKKHRQSKEVEDSEENENGTKKNNNNDKNSNTNNKRKLLDTFENTNIYKLPHFCNKNSFNYNCLESAEVHSFSKYAYYFYEHLYSLSYIHLSLLLLFILSWFFFYESINAKNMVILLFASSIFVGLLANIQIFFSFFKSRFS